MYPTKTSVKLTYTPTLLISRNIFKWEWFFVFSTNLITRANDFTQLLKRMWRTQKYSVEFHEFFYLIDFTWNRFSWIKLETLQHLSFWRLYRLSKWKLISRKIWMTEKLLIFHTVRTEEERIISLRKLSNISLALVASSTLTNFICDPMKASLREQHFSLDHF